jgi:hypothetical protein
MERVVRAVLEAAGGPEATGGTGADGGPGAAGADGGPVPQPRGGA